MRREATLWALHIERDANWLSFRLLDFWAQRWPSGEWKFGVLDELPRRDHKYPGARLPIA